MTVYGLIERHERNNAGSYFFSRNTLKFFGERISEMRVLKKQATITDYCGKEHNCYVLSSYQRNYPCGARRAYHYFDSETFEVVHFPED